MFGTMQDSVCFRVPVGSDVPNINKTADRHTDVTGLGSKVCNATTNHQNTNINTILCSSLVFPLQISTSSFAQGSTLMRLINQTAPE